MVVTLQNRRSDDQVQSFPGQWSERRIVRAAKFIRFSPWTVSKIITTITAARLWYRNSHPNRVHRGCRLLAQGVMEIVTNELMKLLMANMSDTAIYKHHGIKVAVANDMTGQVAQLGDHSNFNQP